jgi:uncharacterized membrane protein (DUF441 family)
MSYVVIMLVVIASLAFLFRDYLLAVAALVLLLFQGIDFRPGLAMIQKYSFQIGIFFLMMYLLFPLTVEKSHYSEWIKELFSPVGIFAVIAGMLISYIGGRGVGILPSQPVILFGVILGTLIAVLFFRGLPAGIIIAAGLLSFFYK